MPANVSLKPCSSIKTAHSVCILQTLLGDSRSCVTQVQPRFYAREGLLPKGNLPIGSGLEFGSTPEPRGEYTVGCVLMSTLTPPQPEARVSGGTFLEHREPDLTVLQDRIPAHLRMSRKAVGIVVLLALLFLTTSYQPLHYSDLWGHLSYGRWIWANQAVPRVEPLMPLAEGVPFVDIAWLSQLTEYGLVHKFGTAGAQFFYAGLITAAFTLILGAVYRRTESLLAVLAAFLTFGGGGYQQLLIVRPQLAGLAAFCLVLVVATSSVERKWHWWAVPLTFALWANLHGSFVVGLGLMGLMALGRSFDIIWRTGQLTTPFRDSVTRRLVLLTQLGAAAVLLNPYGVRVYAEALAVPRNLNLLDLIEWDALSLKMNQGQAAAAITIALFLLYRMSPRRVTCGEMLTLVTFGLAALWTSRYINWWAPLAAYYVGIHLAAITWKNFGRPVEAPRRTGLNSVLAVGLVWIFFAYTPFGVTMLHGQPSDPKLAAKKYRNSVSADTPLGVTSYLRENPPVGAVFNTYEWGDYLTWAGPPGIQVFLNSHAHLVPREVWLDYMHISGGGSSWEAKLNAYSVNTVVVDRQRRAALIRSIEQKPADWESVYEDGLGVVFRRKQPL